MRDLSARRRTTLRSRSGGARASERKQVEADFKDPEHPLRVVVVRDMWLTGFDVPSLLHDLRRQADARPRPAAGDRARQPRLPRQAGGLVVDYIGIGDDLKASLAAYSAEDVEELRFRSRCDRAACGRSTRSWRSSSTASTSVAGTS